jgi:hypothetical protein
VPHRIDSWAKTGSIAGSASGGTHAFSTWIGTYSFRQGEGGKR